MFNTLGNVCPSYETVEIWVSSFKRDKSSVSFSVKEDERSERQISAFTSENVNTVHDLILSDRRISMKQICI